jgi:6-pyruvoyltetrahydropterin/6-carboxytetrahydropterin synthase
VYLIAKTFGFSASHRLDGLEPGHPCGRDHGHNYTVRVALAAEDVDPTGFVADFHRLEPVGCYISDTLDHRHLNDVLPFQPSSELLARHFFQWCQDHLASQLTRLLHHTAVSENSTSWVIYAPAGLWCGDLA